MTILCLIFNKEFEFGSKKICSLTFDDFNVLTF